LKKAKKLIAILFAFVFIITCFSVLASAADTVRLNTWWLVDWGGNMDWGGSTKYQSDFNFAVGVWNSHRNVIKKVTFFTMTDLVLTDITDTRTSAAAATTYRRVPIINGALNAGQIEFNTAKIDKVNQTMKRHTILHELGHALGLDHNQANDIMAPSVVSSTARTTLTANDKASANAAWKKFS